MLLLRCVLALVVANRLSVVAIEADARGHPGPPVARQKTKPPSQMPPHRAQTGKRPVREKNRKQQPSRKKNRKHRPPSPAGKAGTSSPVRKKPPSFEEKTFRVLDRDRDRRVTLEEVEESKARLAELSTSGPLKNPVQKRLNELLTTLDVIARVDENMDGVLTLEEWRGVFRLWRAELTHGWKRSAFVFMDTNSDGNATRAEMVEAMGKLQAMQGEANHTNDDFKDEHRKLLSFLELRAATFYTRGLGRADNDTITKEEFLATLRQQHPGQTHKQNAQNRGHGKSKQTKHARPSQDRKAQQESKRAKRFEERDEKVFAFLDKNGDGIVEASEAEEARANLHRGKGARVKMEMEHRFLMRSLRDKQWHANADQSGDGRLTLDELRIFHRSAREAKKVAKSNRRAGTQRGGEEAHFRILDRDKNGKISSAELSRAKTRLESREARGRATAFESSLIRAVRSQDSFASLDTDGSGDIDRIEWKLALGATMRQQEL